MSPAMTKYLSLIEIGASTEHTQVLFRELSKPERDLAYATHARIKLIMPTMPPTKEGWATVPYLTRLLFIELVKECLLPTQKPSTAT